MNTSDNRIIRTFEQRFQEPETGVSTNLRRKMHDSYEKLLT
jgi:hypothetical protein